MSKRSRRSATVKRAAAARQSSAVKRSSPGKHRNGIRRHKPAGRQTLAPSRKTLAATIGSAIAATALYFANKSGAHAVTPELTSLITVAATFVAAWLIPPGAREAIIATDRGHRTAIA